MFYLKIRDGKETLFFNGEKTEEEFFEFTIDKYGQELNENNKPVILEKTPVLQDEEGKEEDFDDFMDGFGFNLVLDTTAGETLYEDLDKTIIIPRLFDDGTPISIRNFKWYIDGMYVDDVLYLPVEIDDINGRSNIYTLEVTIERGDEEVVVEESVEIIYLDGIERHPEDDTEGGDPDPDGGDDEDDDEAQDNGGSNGGLDVDDPSEWAVSGESFINSQDFKGSDYNDMYQRLRNGDDKRRVFTDKLQEIENRILDNRGTTLREISDQSRLLVEQSVGGGRDDRDGGSIDPDLVDLAEKYMNQMSLERVFKGIDDTLNDKYPNLYKN